MLTRLYADDFVEKMKEKDSCKFTKYGLYLLFDYLEDYHPEDYVINFTDISCQYNQLSGDDIRMYYTFDDDTPVINFLQSKTVVVCHFDDSFIFEEF